MTKKLLAFLIMLVFFCGTIPADYALAASAAKRRASSRKKSGKRVKSSKSRRGSRYAKSRRGRAGNRTARRRGGPPASAIPPERIREIQEALKREGYLNTEPSGSYDKATVEAMSNFQKAHNFRATGYPTAESLNRLGLSRPRRVNPPATPGSDKETPSSQNPAQVPNN